MCGRFTLFADELDILKEYGLDHKIKGYEKRYNIAPSQDVLAVINDGSQNRGGFLRWGLVPSWAKDSKIGYKMINARSETAHAKPSFKKLLERRRCLIVADSFYEWKKFDDKKKVPMQIKLKNRHLFGFAGLWDRWKQGENELTTCTILTREPNEFMASIHDRMPVILPKEKEKEWINNKQYTAEEMRDFLLSLEVEDLSACEVDALVKD